MSSLDGGDALRPESQLLLSEIIDYDYEYSCDMYPAAADSSSMLLGRRAVWLEGDSLAPPCQADAESVGSILDFLQSFISEKDIVYDLGCGDGRIPIAAAYRFGCKAVGIEIEDRLADIFRTYLARIQESGTLSLCEATFNGSNRSVYDLVSVRSEDLLTSDISDATIIVVYLLPESIELIRAVLISCLSRGGVVVCNTWGARGLHCTERRQCGNLTLLKYTKDSLIVADCEA